MKLAVNDSFSLDYKQLNTEIQIVCAKKRVSLFRISKDLPREPNDARTVKMYVLPLLRL